jgi:hypothetical protein
MNASARVLMLTSQAVAQFVSVCTLLRVKARRTFGNSSAEHAMKHSLTDRNAKYSPGEDSRKKTTLGSYPFAPPETSSRCGA